MDTDSPNLQQCNSFILNLNIDEALLITNTFVTVCVVYYLKDHLINILLSGLIVKEWEKSS